MAFSKYKEIGQVQQEFGISLLEQSFIPEEVVAPSEAFRREFEFTLSSFPIISEGARTETIIFPVLREVYKDYHHSFTLWIEKPLSFNAQLSGTPDYILAAKSPLGKTVFTKPLVAMVEAKKNDFDYGWGQCLAELVAAQKCRPSQRTSSRSPAPEQPHRCITFEQIEAQPCRLPALPVQPAVTIEQ